jgi:hypothetical protein
MNFVKAWFFLSAEAVPFTFRQDMVSLVPFYKCVPLKITRMDVFLHFGEKCSKLVCECPFLKSLCLTFILKLQHQTILNKIFFGFMALLAFPVMTQEIYS